MRASMSRMVNNPGEHDILNRPLTPEEVQHFTDTARRIGAILLAAT